MREFDRKFGAGFLGGVPPEPGVYRLFDGAGTLLYVGKARNLRRRLAQYRTTRRTRRDRKRRALIRAAARITWEPCASELEASLREIQLIQALRPRENVAGAFPFLYPFIGLRAEGREIYFCLTTSPDAFPTFDLHGAFRSRDVTGEAFFSLMRLLAIVGHRVSHKSRAAVAHSYVFGFRRLPSRWPMLWDRLLRGESREALEELALSLLEHASARARSAAVQEALHAVARFVDAEVRELADAIAAAGYSRYPVPQTERDLLVFTYRQHVSARTSPAPPHGPQAART